MVNPRNHEIPNSIREVIILKYKDNEKPKDIDLQLKLNIKSVNTIIYRYKKTGSFLITKRSGRSKKLRERIQRRLIRNIKKDPFINYNDCKKDITTFMSIKTTNKTIANVLKKNIRRCISSKKFFVSDSNTKKE